MIEEMLAYNREFVRSRGYEKLGVGKKNAEDCPV